MLPTFSQNLTLKEAFETVAQINKELKRNGILQKIQTIVDRFSSFFG